VTVFVAHDVDCGVGFATAQTRLFGLVAGRVLLDASRAAYHEGLAGLGLAEPRLARVRSFTCGRGGGQVTTGLRWEAGGVSAGPFPVLDADLTLSPADRSSPRLALVGVYRPPFGNLGRDLGPALSARVADLTVRALLHSVAGHLTGARVIFPPVRIPRPAQAS
jgi:hypothetical protein